MTARVTMRTPLRYRDGADAALDRPPHVRAASGAAFVAGRMAVIQDDANFIALVDPVSGVAESLPLPAGHGGRRLFDDRRGNKRFKLDLEACVAIVSGSGIMLVAFGSGSSPARQRIVVVDRAETREPTVSVVTANALYESLRRETAFAGSDLNIEGALLRDGRITLFGCGNGEAAGELVPLNATCALDWSALERYLRAPGTVLPPPPRDVVQYVLGSIDGFPLGFTDAATWGDAVMFSAVAEDSPDARRDGRVAGSVLGIIAADGQVRHTRITGERGIPFHGKVEGLAIDRGGRAVLYALVDDDDSDTAAELCVIEVTGSWPSREGV